MQTLSIFEAYTELFCTSLHTAITELTLSYLGEVEPVHPGDLTEGAGSVEDHHDAHWTTRPGSKKVLWT